MFTLQKTRRRPKYTEDGALPGLNKEGRVPMVCGPRFHSQVSSGLPHLGVPKWLHRNGLIPWSPEEPRGAPESSLQGLQTREEYNSSRDSDSGRVA